jgi:hypothetical protein
MCYKTSTSTISTIVPINIIEPQIINAVPVEVPLLEAEIPLELLLSLNDLPLITNEMETIKIIPLINIEDINSGDINFPQKHITPH